MGTIDKEEYADYQCPECGWDHLEEGFYYIKDGEIHDCTKYEDKTFRLSPNPPAPYKAYPVYSNEKEDIGASMEFGGSPTMWEETHLCPNCNIEFTFSDSSC